MGTLTNWEGVKWIAWNKLCVPKGCGGLGVRDLKNFNIAMLAKQGWRLLNETNPLVFAIMKAKYYPNMNFLNAEIGTNPSYVWRSITTTLEAVKLGARRKIGNGEDTNVWSMPWLPSLDNRFLTTLMPSYLRDITVRSFMETEVNKWDLDVISDVYDTRDIELIKRIPILMNDKVDSWFWLLDEKGDFTSLKLPGKVINFLWRVCKGYLPTAHALALKQVAIDARCPWCHNELESDTHVLFSCDFAKTVWLNAGMHHLVQVSPHYTAFLVLFKSFDVCTREQSVLIGMICWSTWNRRNKWVWEKANGSVFGVRAAATNLLKDWKEAQESGNNRRSQGDVGSRIWSKPAMGWLKINVDAVIFQDGSIGIGSVIRDSQGRFIGARCIKVEGSWQPREAEAISLKEAMSWITDLKYDHCIFETASKSLADACNGKPGEAFFGTIVLDCVHLLKHINHVLVEFVYRSMNSVVHVLAKATYSMSGLGEWYVTPPDFHIHVSDSDNT